MSVERSGRGVLTTNAYTNTVETFFSSTFSTSGQWHILDNTTIYGFLTGGQTSDNKCSLDHIVWNGYSGLDYKLEYSIIIRAYNSSQILFESGWVPNNEICYSYVQWGTDIRVRPTIEVYVRRNEFDDNGDRKYLVPSDMRPSYFKAYYTYPQSIVQTTALPQNWLETTTQSIPTYTTQTTMLTTVDYEGYLSTLTIPIDVRPAIATLDQLINDLWSLHYIPFVVCFALIMGLAIWLLH